MSSQAEVAEHLKRQLIQKAKKRAKDLARDLILKNPKFWIVIAILLLIFLFVFLIATFVSSSAAVASQNIMSEKIIPPQIYASDMEELITSDFGKRTHPVTGEEGSFHSGIDIDVPEGTPVQSSFDGIVESVSFPNTSDPVTTQNAGIHVVVKSSDPEVALSSRYLHLSQIFVTAGQTVKKGDIIGLSGNTGRSTGAHLHYELIPDGESEATDPKPFVMMTSKLVDIASEEAFKAFKKINWSNSNLGLISYLPTYYSKPMLYLSDMYFAAPEPSTFPSAGAGYYKNISTGSLMGSFSSYGASPIEPPPDNEVVTIPVDPGSLTDPFFLQYASAAQNEELRSGVPASITLAQAALESGEEKVRFATTCLE